MNGRDFVDVLTGGDSSPKCYKPDKKSKKRGELYV